ncbi:protein NRT1/ PTR FAMILY 1.3-like [Ziziphus jujuba]|uniref:Protein NRT1/ PTR FAMILY 1.3-like n=1 Tax=Ziziphus jujuba TaxID=326968 RepID=A0A6P6G7U3_ZIZJJ|nr:protein NRT1/ PTR FAMILY 1.3-like [Ziziphus jujuba]
MTTSPVDEENGMAEEPLLSGPKPKAKGGIITLPFIIANEAFERLANHGLRPNMILYLTRKYGLAAASASTLLLLWSAATDFMPVFGAFLADSYVGRYPMIGFGSVLCFLGMVMLWLTTIFHEQHLLVTKTAKAAKCTQKHPDFYTCTLVLALCLLGLEG